RQRDGGQYGEQQSIEAGMRDRAPEHVLHRSNVGYRHFLIHRVDLTGYGGRQASRFHGRARHQDAEDESPGVVWPVGGRWNLAVEIGGFDIAYNADDLIPMVFPVEFDAAAQWVFVGPETSSHCFIDDDHPGVILDDLTLGEVSAHPHRNAHRSEEVTVDHADIGSGSG